MTASGRRQFLKNFGKPISDDNLKFIVKELKPFNDKNYPTLLGRPDLDAVIIATPHYFHPPLAIQAFEKGLMLENDRKEIFVLFNTGTWVKYPDMY